MKLEADPGRWALRLGAWLSSAIIGYELVLNRWIPGAVFGAAVVVWRWTDTKQISAARSSLFVVASTLNFALVLEIAGAALPSAPVFNLIEPSVIVGTVLLPVAHLYLFRLRWREILVAVPAMYFTAFAVGTLGIGSPLDTIVNPVAAWQLAYLLLLRSRPIM